MRLPFPTRIPIQKTVIFAAAVLLLQLLEHTDLYFAILFFAFIMLSALAFNIAGGFSRASGTYVFWFALLTCIIGGLWKIVLVEPGDSNLISPVADMAIYVVGMALIILALFISHRFTRNARGLSHIIGTDKVNLGLASLGCLLASQISSYALQVLPGGNGTLSSFLNQEKIFLPLTVLLGTVYTIRASGGRRSVNIVTAIASILMFVFDGLVSYSKQAMFTFFVCWLVAAASQRYYLRLWQILLMIGFAVYAVTILSPLSQVARAIVPDDAGTFQRIELSIDLLSHPLHLRELYSGNPEPQSAGLQSPVAQGYFNTSQGLFDRLTIIKSDDRLVSYTLQGHTDGYARYLYYFINWIPHFILPNKESFAPPGGALAGNYYAHETGGFLAPDDFSTGISFSPTAEAFHLGGWLGLFLLGGFTWTLLFTTIDLVCGDLRFSPYGLIAAVAFAHVAPESLLANLVQFIWVGNIGIIVAIVFCTYFAPVLGTLLSGREDSNSKLAAMNT